MHFFIHSYPGTVLGFLFVTRLAEKLYKILHTLSLVFSEMLAVPQGVNIVKRGDIESPLFYFQNSNHFLSLLAAIIFLTS